jgi:hypothetical protein
MSYVRVYSVIIYFTYRFSMILCRSGSVFCVRSWRTCFRLSKVNVVDRELLREMPSIRAVLNQCVEYNIVFDCALYHVFNYQVSLRCIRGTFRGIYLITFFSYM